MHTLDNYAIEGARYFSDMFLQPAGGRAAPAARP